MNWLRNKSLDDISWQLIWFTLPLHLQLNSLSLVFFGLVSVVLARKSKAPIKVEWFWLLPMMFFGMHLIQYWTDPQSQAVLYELEKKLSFLFLPLVFLIGRARNDFEHFKSAFVALVGGLAVISAIMVGKAFVEYLHVGELGVFRYHRFAGSFHSGAIFLSWLMAYVILQIEALKNELSTMSRSLILSGAFMMLVLLSSKLFVVMTIILFMIQQRHELEGRFKLVPVALFIVLGVVALYPRLSNFQGLHLEVVTQKNFSWDTPFNGLNFRLLQWRFAGEILTENKAWLSGVGIGSEQDHLNSKFLDTGVYSGNPELGDSGYIDYNFHNQFLETTVALGLPGLILLLLIIFTVLIRSRTNLFLSDPSWLLITLAFLFTESVFERHVGIVFFCLILSVGYQSVEEKKLR